MPSTYAKALAKQAIDLHTKFHLMDEGEAPLAAQIKKFWTDLDLQFPGVETAWSAVFVSWCVKKAGAEKTEFPFSSQHSVFVKAAIRNETNGTGVFRGVPFQSVPPEVGDILQNNRNGNSYDYAFAKANGDYFSHAAIVVEVGQDEAGPYALTVGGNEGDSIRRKIVRLSSKGLIKPKSVSNFICLIKTLK